MNVCSTPVRETLSGEEEGNIIPGGAGGTVHSIRKVDESASPPAPLDPKSIHFVDSLGQWFTLDEMNTPKPFQPVATLDLDVDPMRHMYVEASGVVGFYEKAPATEKRNKRDLRLVGGIRTSDLFEKAGDLRQYLPAFVPILEERRSLYMTLNEYKEAAFRRYDSVSKRTGLQGFTKSEFADEAKRETLILNLTTCYAEVDCGRGDEEEDPAKRMEFEDALAAVEKLQRLGMLPQASIIGRSGRGLWLYWLLRDPQDPAKAQRANPERIALYKQINERAWKVLKAHGLAADTLKDAARLHRPPGSFNPKAKEDFQQVGWVIRANGAGHSFLYSLDSLCSFFGLAAPAESLPGDVRKLAASKTNYRRPRNMKTKGTKPRRSEGPRIRAAERAQDLVKIEAHHGGFKIKGAQYPNGMYSGGRQRALEFYAWVLRISLPKSIKEDETSMALARAEAFKAVSIMADNCKPPFRDVSVESIIAKEFDKWDLGERKRMDSRDLICSILAVDESMMDRLCLKRIISSEVATARITSRPTKRKQVEERQAFALNAWRAEAANGRRLSCWNLARLYKDNGFTGANQQTANLDLHALGLVEKKTKPAARGTQTALAL